MSPDPNQIITGDSLDVLPSFPENSVHAVVTDPPYGLAFMAEDWDRFTAEEYQEWCRDWGQAARRVLKPGGYLLAFSSNRTHHRLFTGLENAGLELRDTLTWHYGNGFPKNNDTQLKPSTEFVALARNPFDGTAADCHDEHGTAYLNTDDCRVGEYERFPSNTVLDEAAADRLDDEVGELDAGGTPSKRQGIGGTNTYGDADGQEDLGQRVETNSGGPSRYFYTSKATEAERTLNGKISDAHPTVKPLDLMQWLVKLVSRDDQRVLDPFAGTGTTCKAAKDLGREWVGVEKNPQWADVARTRCGLAAENPANVRDDDGQTGFEQFAGGDD